MIACGPVSSVGIATDYGLDGAGSNHQTQHNLRSSGEKQADIIKHTVTLYLTT